MNADAATQGSLKQLITNPPLPVTSMAKKKNKAVPKPIHKMFLELCHQHGFVGFSFPRIETFNSPKEGVKKTSIGLVNKAKGQITPANFTNHIKPKHKAFAIMTGQNSGITVIDCNSKESYEKNQSGLS